VTNPVSDVCIVGGGPAGATVAIRLAGLGHRIDLIERYPGPRPHPGESLSDGILDVLGTLGIRDRLASAIGVRAAGAHLCWEDSRAYHFRDTPRWLLADRTAVGQALLDTSRDRGVRIVQPVTVLGVERRGAGWHVRTAGGGTVSGLTARFLVDATGRSGLLPGRRRPTAPPTVGIYGELSGTAVSAPCVEALPEGWLWAASVRPRHLSVILFVDADTLRGDGRAGLEPRLRSGLAGSRLLARAADAPLTRDVRAYDATCYVSSDVAGEGFVKIGEASAALDPLSSSGVERAMRSAVTAAAVVHTALVRPNAAELARQFFRDREREASEHHAAWTGSAYAASVGFGDRPFWRKRARTVSDEPAAVLPRHGHGLDGPVVLSPELRFLETGCLVGDLVEPRLAVHLPGMARPVAFVDDVELAPLLRLVEGEVTLSSLIERWRELLAPLRAARIAEWLVRSGILAARTSIVQDRDGC
jgi:flavin-dependent dehydrogenase